MINCTGDSEGGIKARQSLRWSLFIPSFLFVSVCYLMTLITKIRNSRAGNAWMGLCPHLSGPMHTKSLLPCFLPRCFESVVIEGVNSDWELISRRAHACVAMRVYCERQKERGMGPTGCLGRCCTLVLISLLLCSTYVTQVCACERSHSTRLSGCISCISQDHNTIYRNAA